MRLNPAISSQQVCRVETQLASLGRIVRGQAGLEGRLQRVFAHSTAAVWTMLTDSAAMAQWLAPAASCSSQVARYGSILPTAASPSTATCPRSRPAVCRNIRGAAASNRSARCWELQDVRAGTQLQLSMRVPEGEDLAKACAGFDAHLEMLAAALEDVIKFPFDVFVQARKAYAEQVAALLG